MLDSDFEVLLEGALHGNNSQRQVKTLELALQLEAEIDRVVAGKGLGDTQARISQLSGFVTKLEAARKSAAGRDIDARAFMDAGSAVDDMPAGVANKGFVHPSIRDTPVEVWKSIHDAALSGKSLRTELGTKSPFGESSLSPGLPSLIAPQLTQILPYEPDRLFTHFTGATMSGPSIEYLVHSGNANPAAAVAELGTKPDIGMELSTRVATPTKIAGLASISMEALQDFDSFLQFVPSELMRAVIDAETNEIVNGSGSSPHQLGLLNVSGTLTRAFPTSGDSTLTALDCLELAINDLRVGAAYCKADMMAMHPGTFSFLRRQKDDYGRYLLEPDPTAQRASSIWGIDVIQNSWIPNGTVILADHTAILGWIRHGLTLEQNYWGDSQWTQNYVSFRAEERIAIGVLRPAAVCIVTGLNADTSSTEE